MWKHSPTVHGNNANSSPTLAFIREKIKSILCILLCVIVIVSMTVLNAPVGLEHSRLRVTRPRNFLDGCRHVYIDMGTNIGIQIRKLYEPHLYKDALILQYFSEIFQNDTSGVCSVGFEANPVHDKYLREFQTYCVKRGWRVKIFTSTAVSTKDGNVTFHIDPADNVNNQWGARIGTGDYTGNITVRSIDIVSWLKTYVFSRTVPAGLPLPKIMMKSDIEGHDPNVLADMILKGVYCSIDFIYAEHLSQAFLDGISELQRFSSLCETKLLYIDDETYYQSRFPFTFPNSTNSK